MEVLIQLQNTKTKDRKRMRKEPPVPQESLGWPAAADQTQACAGTCAHSQLSRERTALHLFPLLHGYEMLEHSNCWKADGVPWDCSVSPTRQPLCFPITCPHCYAARYHCRSRQCLPEGLCAGTEASLWICSQSCSSDLLIKFGTHPCELQS